MTLRSRWSNGVRIVLLAAVVTACGPRPGASAGALDSEAALVGTWVGTGLSPGEVTMVLEAAGTFTWSNGDLHGTWASTGDRLTFSYPEESYFCSGGSLTWTYELRGDSLTADLAEATCSVVAPSGSPDWTFTRQP
jgi:hypothetical protein